MLSLYSPKEWFATAVLLTDYSPQSYNRAAVSSKVAFSFFILFPFSQRGFLQPPGPAPCQNHTVFDKPKFYFFIILYY